MARKMKIVLFGNSTTMIAAIRYRLVAFAERLRAEGHTCVVCVQAPVSWWMRLYEGRPKWSKILYMLLVLARRVWQLRHVVGADVVFFRGPVFDYGPPIFERIIHALNPRMVFDIDDAIWEPAAHVTSPFLRFVDLGWVRKMSGMCRYAIVGNRYLEAYVHACNPDLPVAIIPTCVDMSLYTPKQWEDRREEDPVILGWAGLRDNLGYLEIIEPVLQRLAKKYRIRLAIATRGRTYELAGVEVVNHEFDPAREADYMREADIGLMPLKDTLRAKGKCAFKAIQYMAVGVPAVISPVGMNAEVVTDGISGFLASTPSEWEQKLERLIVDAGLRQRMGDEARRTALERYSLDANYPVFLDVMKKVAGESPSDPAMPA
ncbi:MAG TPA: glycosyltransferase [Candidatus Hydrogenedentes bacterium]|nr:glycosyltransferase [Candidatus Hydrogenedentota bacterium]